MKTCTHCQEQIKPLEEFPNCLCLSCYEITQEHTSPEEDYATIMRVFGGRK